MGGYKWRGDDGEERRKEIEMALQAIREEAKKRTEWAEWMTEEVGYAAVGTIQD